MAVMKAHTETITQVGGSSRGYTGDLTQFTATYIDVSIDGVRNTYRCEKIESDKARLLVRNRGVTHVEHVRDYCPIIDLVSGDVTVPEKFPGIVEMFERKIDK